MGAAGSQIAAGVIALGVGFSTVAGGGGADVCAPAVDAALRQYGLSLAEIDDASFVVHRWQDDPNMAEDDRPIGGYSFYGRPRVCATGSIAIDMWENCAISDLRSRGGCRITGIRYGWP